MDGCYLVDRERFQRIDAFYRLCERLLKMAGDEWGDPSYGAVFENDVFKMRRFSWDDCDCMEQVERDEEPPADCDVCGPNFVHKPSGYKLWWYKYPFRGAEHNRDYNSAEFEQIVLDCDRSLDRPDPGNAPTLATADAGLAPALGGERI